MFVWIVEGERVEGAPHIPPPPPTSNLLATETSAMRTDQS